MGLDKWLPAMWQVVNCKNVASSYEVHLAIGVAQKTGMVHGSPDSLRVANSETEEVLRPR